MSSYSLQLGVGKNKMKKIILGLFALLMVSLSVQAYEIGGAYARLLSCNWGQYGYEYGYIGTYRCKWQNLPSIFW